jgi:predicted RNase H-like nuclease (RuvC/YqgF family)
MDDADDERSAASAKSSKSIKSLTKTMKALEKDNQRLKKSVSTLQKCDEDDDDDSSLSSVEESTHFQEAVETLRDSYPKIALALKSKKSMVLDLRRNVLLLDNQSTFDLCCNKKFTSSVKTALNARNMTSNGGGLRISEKCKLPGYKFWVWFCKRASPTSSVSRI